MKALDALKHIYDGTFIDRGKEPTAMALLAVVSAVGALVVQAAGLTTWEETAGAFALGAAIGTFGLIVTVRRERKATATGEEPGEIFSKFLRDGFVGISMLLVFYVVTSATIDHDRWFALSGTAGGTAVIAAAGFIWQRSSLAEPA